MSILNRFYTGVCRFYADCYNFCTGFISLMWVFVGSYMLCYRFHIVLMHPMHVIRKHQISLRVLISQGSRWLHMQLLTRNPNLRSKNATF